MTVFNEKKAAQAAAFFLFQAGQPMSVLKLMKLLYLAERRSFELHGSPMIGDRLVSMPNGPVLSATHNHMNGELEPVEGGWESWIADRAGHDLDLRDRTALRDPARDLLELSDADAEILADVWKQFGRMSGSGLRNWTHKNCPEWKDPEGSMIPMKLEELFAALKYSPEQTREALERLESESAVTAAFDSVKN